MIQPSTALIRAYIKRVGAFHITDGVQNRPRAVYASIMGFQHARLDKKRSAQEHALRAWDDAPAGKRATFKLHVLEALEKLK